VRSAPPLTEVSIVTAVVLAIVPVVDLWPALRGHQWTQSLWLGCALVGAGAAGYAAAHLGRAERRAATGPAMVAVAIGCAIMMMAWLQQGQPSPRVWVGVTSVLRYAAVCFVLEEVTFRGALDGYAHAAGARGGWAMAVYISALWGLWHLPIIPRAQWGVAPVVAIMVVHTAVGVPLTFAWRRAGNLLPAALAHAVVDGVRNALMGA
jgi:membrane protease YdiL (CAAX protease family)